MLNYLEGMILFFVMTLAEIWAVWPWPQPRYHKIQHSSSDIYLIPTKESTLTGRSSKKMFILKRDSDYFEGQSHTYRITYFEGGYFHWHWTIYFLICCELKAISINKIPGTILSLCKVSLVPRVELKWSQCKSCVRQKMSLFSAPFAAEHTKVHQLAELRSPGNSVTDTTYNNYECKCYHFLMCFNSFSH